METLKKRSFELYFFIRKRIHLFTLLLSILSLIVIFTKILNLDINLGLSKFTFFDVSYQIIVILGIIYTVLFLPTYPIFFIIRLGKNFNVLERISITIVLNSVFYILLGYIGYWIGAKLDAFFFFYALLIMFLLLFGYILFNEIKEGKYHLLKPGELKKERKIDVNSFSLLDFLKRKVTVNGFLLLIFIFLICLLSIVRFSYFVGTDPWLHIFISKMITEFNYLPIDLYHGELGFHIFGAVINLFSGLNHVLIPKFFVFYTFFVSALIFYNLMMRIFKVKNLALFGVFILEFSSLGFSTMMLQYWPSGSALIKCLMIFFLLYTRLQDFIQEERPTNKSILSNIFVYYTLIILIFISSVLTHVVTTLVFLFSFLWLFFIYFLKDYKRGFDFILLVGLVVIFFIFNIFGIGSGHYWFFIPLNLPLSLIFLGVGAGGVAGLLLFWKLQKSITFTKGRYKEVIFGKRNRYYKKIEDNFILPLIFSILILFVGIFLIANLIWLNLAIINVFYVFEILMFSAFAIWGLIVFQKKPRGKPLYLWSLGLLLLLGAGFIFNILILPNMIWQRILYLIPPVIVIGFISYIYKHYKLGSFSRFRIKFIVLFIIISSLFITYFYEQSAFEIFNLKRREVRAMRWYTRYTSNTNLVLTEFGWKRIINYYDYPFEDENATIIYNGTEYLKYPIDLFPPENHKYDNGTNILQEIKEKYGTDLYIIFSDDYIINKGFELFGKLTKEQEEQYYSLDYLDRIFSSKSLCGEDLPIYWVI